MTVNDIMLATKAKLLTPNVKTDGEIKFGYCCDLLSWVMTRACKGTVWVTVMTHLNVIAVAALLEIGCVLIPESISVEASVLERAEQEGIPVLSSEMTTFELAGILYTQGLSRPEKG